MKKFKQHLIIEQYQSLLEALITFGGKAYPKGGNVVIMAGGAGSGKGFLLQNLIGLEGMVFDVDALKSLAGKAEQIRHKVKSEYGYDLEKITSDLRNPDNVAMIHAIISDYLDLPDKKLSAFLRGAMLAKSPDLLPNIIFDVTLKDLRKLDNITRQVKAVGYDVKNIHIVWAVNSIDVALQQNANRNRVVPKEILINTHRGVSQTMRDIVSMGSDLTKYMDGDVVLAFNKIGIDSNVKKSSFGGSFIKNANYVYIKKRGKPIISHDQLDSKIKRKINDYVPKNINWI